MYLAQPIQPDLQNLPPPTRSDAEAAAALERRARTLAAGAVQALIEAAEAAETAIYRLNGGESLPGWVSGVVVDLRNAIEGLDIETSEAGTALQQLEMPLAAEHSAWKPDGDVVASFEDGRVEDLVEITNADHTETFAYAVDLETARRISACANACAGVPTQTLERARPGEVGGLVLAALKAGAR